MAQTDYPEGVRAAPFAKTLPTMVAAPDPVRALERRVEYLEGELAKAQRMIRRLGRAQLVRRAPRPWSR